jgi:DNA repair protein RecO (recombination protein O)
MVVDLQCYEGRSLDVIQQAESLGAYGAPIAADYGAFTAANAIAETADRLTDEASQQQYLLLVGALRSLARGEHGPALTLDSYLLRALSLAGWAPSIVDCAVTGIPGPHSAFVVQLGGIVADEVAPPGAPRLTPQTVALLSALLRGDWPLAESADATTRAQASGVIAAYTQWHLERGLKSLNHLDKGLAARVGTAQPQPVGTAETPAAVAAAAPEIAAPAAR